MIGQTISQYTITGTLGAGGMGVVYRARDNDLDREVALKFLQEGPVKDERAAERFIIEARAAGWVFRFWIDPLHQTAGLSPTDSDSDSAP